MKVELSKRKYESLLRAEKTCQELRFQMSLGMPNYNAVYPYLSKWMCVTGNIKYKRPE